MHVFYLEAPNGERFDLSNKDTTVGRDPSCDIVINDGSLSRQHARFSVAGEALTVTDLGSRNGSSIDGAALAANVAKRVSVGAKLKLGTLVFTVRSDEKADAATPSSLRSTAEFSVEELLPRVKDGAQPIDRVLSEVLYRAQGALFPAQPIDALIESLLHLAAAYVPASTLSVSLISPVTNDLETRASVGERAPQGPALISRGIAEKVMQQRKAVLIRDRLSDAEFAQRASLVKAGITSAAATPIFDGNDILGVLSAYIVDGKRELTETDVSVLTVLASLGGTALVAANMMSDLMRAQAELQAENERLQSELARIKAT